MLNRTPTLEHYIDSTLLLPTATEREIQTLCEDAASFQFYAVCIPPRFVPFVRSWRELHQKGISFHICTVIGFPLGYQSSSVKLFEAQQAIDHGAEELDMVIQLGLLKEQQWAAAEADIRDIVKAGPRCVKVIVEPHLLTLDELKTACALIFNAGAQFVKTHTGFLGGEATLEAVTQLRKLAPPELKVKASGGIRSLEQAQALLRVGADRLGTSSARKLMENSALTGGY